MCFTVNDSVLGALGLVQEPWDAPRSEGNAARPGGDWESVPSGLSEPQHAAVCVDLSKGMLMFSLVTFSCKNFILCSNCLKTKLIRMIFCQENVNVYVKISVWLSKLLFVTEI